MRVKITSRDGPFVFPNLEPDPIDVILQVALDTGETIEIPDQTDAALRYFVSAGRFCVEVVDDVVVLHFENDYD